MLPCGDLVTNTEGLERIVLLSKTDWVFLQRTGICTECNAEKHSEPNAPSEIYPFQ